jgi:arsenical-resistance protein 2
LPAAKHRRAEEHQTNQLQSPEFDSFIPDLKMADASKTSGSWTDAFPAPRTTAPIVTREEALSALSSPDLLIVDVRRTDYEGGTIKGSINLPAHSFYLNRAVLFDLCKRAGVNKVAFYCGQYIPFD